MADQNGPDVRPKRKSAGSKLPGILEALKEENGGEIEREVDDIEKMADGVNGDSGQKSSNAEQVLDLQSECDDLEHEIKKLELEEKKRELTDRLKQLKARSTLQPEGQGNDSEGRGRQDGGAHTPSHAAGKQRNYLDFLWVDALDTQPQSVEISDGVFLEVGKRKKDFSKVSLDMWVYANIGLVRDMITSDETSLAEVSDYLKHCQDICRFSAKYMWSSVLLYDQEYRVRQKSENMRWGTPSQDIRDYQLVPKPNTVTARTFRQDNHLDRRQQHARRGPFAPDGSEICRRFNYGQCFDGACKMTHVCTVCFRLGHNQRQHVDEPVDRRYSGTMQSGRQQTDPKNYHPMA